MVQETIEYIHAGLLPYDETLELQETLWHSRLQDEIPDTLIFFQHLPVFTFEESEKAEKSRASLDILRKLGIDYFQTKRNGGKSHFYSPGQLVTYPIFKLQESALKTLSWQLEEVVLRLLADWGIAAERAKDYSGIAVKGKKIASIRMVAKDNVTTQGIRINVSNDPIPYEILPDYGVIDRETTSMQTELRTPISIAKMEAGLLLAFSAVFNKPVTRSAMFTYAESAYR